jgi:hypothetical protein
MRLKWIDHDINPGVEWFEHFNWTSVKVVGGYINCDGLSDLTIEALKYKGYREVVEDAAADE